MISYDICLPLSGLLYLVWLSLVHPCCCKWHYFIIFLWLSKYGIISLFFYGCEIYIYIYIYHICFIHSSANGHFGCFYILAIVNNAAMNIGVHVPFQNMFFSGYIPRSMFARLYVNFILIYISSAHFLIAMIYVRECFAYVLF